MSIFVIYDVLKKYHPLAVLSLDEDLNIYVCAEDDEMKAIKELMNKYGCRVLNSGEENDKSVLTFCFDRIPDNLETL